MDDYRRELLELALKYDVLRFGEFALKSGRVSPYFFNAGMFNSGYALATLGRLYARAIVDSKISFDMLFGPAYKGIPLVAATTCALAERYQLDVPYAFNRKEVKSYGEGGVLVGAPLAGRVLIVDDVITAGTAVREAVALIDSLGGTAAGVVIALDREERGEGELSAVQEVEQIMGLPVMSILRLADLIEHLTEAATQTSNLAAMEAYRDQYGV